MPKKGQPYLPGSMVKRGIEHVCYEYANLMSAAYWSLNGAPPWRTHADDAFRLGYRKMYDFLLRKQRSKGKGGEQPDILVRDYLPSRYAANWTLSTWERLGCK